MTSKIPVKAIYDGSNVTALGEFTSGDTIAISHGGTNATDAANARINLGVDQANVRTFLSASGNITYNSSTGVISYTQPANVSAFLNDAGYLTIADINENANVISVNGQTGIVTLSTANIDENSNLYFTNARVYSNVTQLGYATTTYVNNELANLVSSAPSTLDTLNELAAALGDDPNFATSTATLIGNANNQANAAYDRANVAVSNASAAFDKANVTFQSLTTANVVELTNLYYTNARVWANVSPTLSLKANVADLTTSNVAEGNNLYYTTTRANTDIDNRVTKAFVDNLGINATTLDGLDSTAFALDTDLTTANVTELTNLYFTNARVYSAISGNLALKANVVDLTTANVTEVTNLYYTAARAYANTINITSLTNLTEVGTLGNVTVTGKTTTNTANVTTLNFADGTNQTSAGSSAGFVLAMSIALG